MRVEFTHEEMFDFYQKVIAFSLIVCGPSTMCSDLSPAGGHPGPTGQSQLKTIKCVHQSVSVNNPTFFNSLKWQSTHMGSVNYPLHCAVLLAGMRICRSGNTVCVI